MIINYYKQMNLECGEKKAISVEGKLNTLETINVREHE